MMEEIRAQQVNRARPMTGRDFVLGVASVVLRLALAQILCNLLDCSDGRRIAQRAVLPLRGVRRWRCLCGARSLPAYTLKQETLVLERKLGDSTTSVVEIPLDQHSGPFVRFAEGERLHVCYRQVTVIDNEAKPTARMKAAWRASLISARLARKIAGAHVHDEIGWAIIFNEADVQRRACVFCPDEAMCGALREALGDRFGLDDRQTRPQVVTLYAQGA
ncbi:MAG: hypothetical protein ACLUHE_04740 [Christensenellales bacterium]